MYKLQRACVLRALYQELIFHKKDAREEKQGIPVPVALI